MTDPCFTLRIPGPYGEPESIVGLLSDVVKYTFLVEVP